MGDNDIPPILTGRMNFPSHDIFYDRKYKFLKVRNCVGTKYFKVMDILSKVEKQGLPRCFKETVNYE